MAFWCDCLKTVFFYVICCSRRASSLHVNGRWSATEFLTVVAKFGFQKTDALQVMETQGFIYGNVTSLDNSGGSCNSASIVPNVYLVLTDAQLFRQLYQGRDVKPRQDACRLMTSQLSTSAFDFKCLTGGKYDFLRHVPCPVDGLCCDEDNAAVVVRGSQFTFKIQDKRQPRFWYLSLMSCYLNTSCNWTNQELPLNLSYDIWLVNGSPSVRYQNPFEHQFSFDQQDTPEIFFTAFFVYCCVAAAQCHSYFNLCKSKRSLLLLGALTFGTLSTFCSSLHTLVFSFDGCGLPALKVIANLLFVTSENLLMLILVLISSGWSITDISVPRRIMRLWFLVFMCHGILFIWNTLSVNELEDVDIFNSWPAWSILLLRVLVIGWFVFELKWSIQRRCDEMKAAFLRHFGAGFLVWFIYYPILDVVATQIPLLWRYKVILSISLLANVVAFCVLLHLFWPKSTNSQFFLSASGLADDLDDFERSILEDLDYDKASTNSTSAANGSVRLNSG